MRAAWLLQGLGFLILVGALVYTVDRAETKPAHQINTTAMQETHMRIRSPAFGHEQTIPSKYTCDGEDLSPPLAIDDAPEGTVSFVLIMDDPDSPTGTWDHWLVYNIPRETYLIGEGSPTEGVQGINSWGKRMYGGPCPGSGEHRYLFKVYALDTVLRHLEEDTKEHIEEAMKGHILERSTLMGRYEKVTTHYED